MSVAALIADLNKRGVYLSARGDVLLVDAPAGAVDPDEKTALRNHKSEIIELLARRQDGGESDPKGDTPATWWVWYQARIQHHNRLGRDRTSAASLAWGEAENIWNQRHGARPDPSRCAGCGQLLSGRERLMLGDGAAVHWDEGAGLDCLGAHGARWRAEATAGLTALCLTPPPGTGG